MDIPSPSDKNYSIREFSSARPKVREDVRFTFDNFRGKTFCVIEDPVTSQFFRTGIPEYHFIKNLNGKNTIAEAISKMAEESGIQALSHDDAFQILNFLLESQLIRTEQSTLAHELADKREKHKHGAIQSKLNPLFIKVPLTYPDRMLNRIKPIIRFFMGKLFFTIWLITMLTAGYNVLRNWDRVTSASAEAFLPHNWFWLLITWASLKFIHETFHGFACKKFGANVPEAGIIFILFTPMGYVDATASWRLGSKWKRIAVGAAGMYIELFIAAIASLIWLSSEPGASRTISYNVMLTGSMITLFFNANPLMRFDGYYILSDYLEIPNLYSRGQQRTKLIAKKVLLGINQLKWPNLADREELIITTYGFLSLFWRVLVVLSLMITAAFLFKGIGIILAAIGLLWWFWIPLYKIVNYILNGSNQEIPRSYQYIPRLTIASIILLLIAFTPYRPTYTAPVVFYSLKAETIRSDAPGFITQILVTEEDSIKKGDLLITLENEDEVSNLNNLKIELEQARIKANIYLAEEPIRFQAQQDTIHALEERIQELKDYVESLSITASSDGIIIPSPKEWEVGQFVEPGTHLYTIVPEKTTEATIVVNQDDADDFQAHVGNQALIKLSGSPIILNSTLTRFIPRASTQLPHPALSAQNGGPLPVLPPQGKDEQPRLTSPHFIGSVLMDIPPHLDINEGVTGTLKFTSQNSQFLFNIFYNNITGYISDLIQKAKVATNS